MNELIKVVQLPVIEEQLRSMKEAVDKRVEEALSLVCTEETIQTVKSARAELNKEFQALEEQRKEVKRPYLAPMNGLRLSTKSSSATPLRQRTRH